MARSMTGYGASELESRGWKCMLEIRSLNQRFLDIRLRLPQSFVSRESELRERIKKICKRGKVECTVRLEPAESKIGFDLDGARVEEIKGVVKEFEKLSGSSLQFQWKDLVQLDLLGNGPGKRPPEHCFELITESLDGALAEIGRMKDVEGQAMSEDLLSRVRICLDWVDELERKSTGQPERQLGKLKKRITDLLSEVDLEPERLNQELALMSDRLDITEELVRLRTHLKQLRKLIGQTEAGRKGEFLLQEINREINTAASKSSSAEISGIAVDFKSELEKMREQLLNLE